MKLDPVIAEGREHLESIRREAGYAEDGDAISSDVIERYIRALEADVVGQRMAIISAGRIIGAGLRGR